MQALNEFRFLVCLIVSLAVLLSGCGGGNREQAPPNPDSNIGAGWATIDSAWANTQNAYLSGTAFISPT